MRDAALVPRPSVDAPSLNECYAEMRRMARRLLSSDSDRFLLQPTELAHEAVIRLLATDMSRFENRAHMLATAARITRHALIDEVRAAKSLKRQPPELMTLWPEDRARAIALEELDEALEHLSSVSVEHARVVELRFSLGLTIEEVAASENLSERTVKRRWAAARAWLQRFLESNDG